MDLKRYEELRRIARMVGTVTISLQELEQMEPVRNENENEEDEDCGSD